MLLLWSPLVRLWLLSIEGVDNLHIHSILQAYCVDIFSRLSDDVSEILLWHNHFEPDVLCAAVTTTTTRTRVRGDIGPMMVGVVWRVVESGGRWSHLRELTIPVRQRGEITGKTDRTIKHMIVGGRS